MIQASPASPRASRMPTLLFWRMNESWLAPPQRATALRICRSAPQINCTLIEWYPFLFRYAYAPSAGPLMRTCVQSIAPMVFGNPAFWWNASLMGRCCSGVYGKVIYCGASRMMPFRTLGRTRLRDGWDMPDRSANNFWKDPVARNPRVVRTCTWAGIGFDL